MKRPIIDSVVLVAAIFGTAAVFDVTGSDVDWKGYVIAAILTVIVRFGSYFFWRSRERGADLS